MLDSNGNGNIENVIKGTKWIINNKDIYNIKIVNISFGTTHNPSNTSELIKNVENMWNEGIIVVAAAGNSGPKSHSITAPGTSRLVITVGSIDDKTFNSGRVLLLMAFLSPNLLSLALISQRAVIKKWIFHQKRNIHVCTNCKRCNRPCS